MDLPQVVGIISGLLIFLIFLITLVKYFTRQHFAPLSEISNSVRDKAVFSPGFHKIQVDPGNRQYVMIRPPYNP